MTSKDDATINMADGYATDEALSSGEMSSSGIDRLGGDCVGLEVGFVEGLVV